MADALSRTDIAFRGGLVLPLRVTKDAYDGLQEALANRTEERWYEIEAHDSKVSIDLRQVVYVQRGT